MPFFLIFVVYELLNLIGAILIILADQAQTAAGG
jgi:hypothetical protein